MKRTLVLMLGLAALGAAAPAIAHHSFSMFDHSKPVTLVGTVVKYEWANPHSSITIQVPASAANPNQAGVWDFEASAPNIMSRQGWSRSTLAPGDKVTATGYALKNGAKGAQLMNVVTTDGKQLWADANRPGQTQAP